MKKLITLFAFSLILVSVKADTFTAVNNEEDTSILYQSLLERSVMDPDIKAQLDYLECIRLSLNLSLSEMYSDVLESLTSLNEDDLNKNINFVCKNSNEIYHCMGSYYTERIRIHPEKRELPVLQKLIPVAQHLTYAICDDDGKMIHTFLNDNGVSCIETNIELLRRCANHNNFIRIQKIKKLNQINDQQCSDINEVKECFLNALQYGCETSIQQIFSKLLNEFMNQLKCAHVIENSFLDNEI